MKKKPQQTQSVTALPPSPDAERRKREIEYTIMMSIRVLCILVCLLLAALKVDFWWILIPAVGAIFLPYFAVVTANAVGSGAAGDVERPSAIVRHDGEQR